MRLGRHYHTQLQCYKPETVKRAGGRGEKEKRYSPKPRRMTWRDETETAGRGRHINTVQTERGDRKREQKDKD